MKREWETPIAHWCQTEYSFVDRPTVIHKMETHGWVNMKTTELEPGLLYETTWRKAKKTQ